MSAEFIAVGMFVGLLVGLFLGHPLAFVLGGLAVIFGYLGWGPSCFYMFINQIFGVMDNYILVAIPLFIFMAQLLDQSGVAESLFSTMRYLFGPIRGGDCRGRGGGVHPVRRMHRHYRSLGGDHGASGHAGAVEIRL
jgi:TRAP-type mannitol/chloroaromatic compound transport system permease large subunit